MLAAAAVKFKIMILVRLGNKSKIAMEIQKYFPEHKIYIEPFFGAGGMYFNKPKSKYNILNDLDSEVFNLFQCVSNNKDELKRQFEEMPIHQDLWNYWKQNKETDPIKKAVRFMFYSNYGYMGKPQTLAFGVNGFKNEFDKLLNKTNEYLFNTQFSNLCFREFFKVLGRIKEEDIPQTMIYCDPPYLGTDDNYSHSFKEQDASDLFDCLIETGCKFGYSEFDHPFILEQAKQRNLNVIVIGERQNLKNRRTEILVTNYKKPLSLFDGM
jgi:DNA adenine methylase